MFQKVEGREGEQLGFEEGSEGVAEVTLVSAQARGELPVNISETVTSSHWLGLSPVEEQRAKELLQRYNHVFAKHVGDLECTVEILRDTTPT